MLTDTFKTYRDTSISANGIKILYSYSIPSSTWEAGLKLTVIEIVYVADDKLILIIVNIIRGGLSSVMGYSLVKRERKIAYEDIF